MTAPVKCRLKSCSKYGRRESMRKAPSANVGWFCDDGCMAKYGMEKAHKAQESRRRAENRKAAQESKKHKAERDALRAKIKVVADVLEQALSSVESMQCFDLSREIEDVLESVQALAHSQEVGNGAE